MWNLVNISVHFRIVRCQPETRKHRRINTMIKYYLKVWCSRIWHRMILWYLFKTDLAICFQRRCSEQGLKCIITSLAKPRGRNDPRLILLVSLCMAKMWCNWLYHRYVVWNRWYMAPIVSHVRQHAQRTAHTLVRSPVSQSNTSVVWLPSCCALIQFDCCLYESWWW